MTHLSCRGLTCAIGDRTILSDVDLDIGRGEMVALVGRNGSGKSTLIRSLTGLRPPVAGSVHVDGSDLTALSPRRRAGHLAHVGQEEGPPEDLLVGEMVALGRIPHRPPWSGGTKGEERIVLDALAAVGLAEQVDRPCQHLSGGERRRAMLARGLAQGTDLLVLDEPTNHLDVHHQIQLLETVRGLGRTVLAAVHDLALAAAHFDRVAVLHEGRLHALGEPAEVLSTDTLREVFAVDAVRLTDPATGRVHLSLGPGALPAATTRKALA
ncbi:ABC transporter ATP-binding protein [Janibacter cremeus]|uniref:ABC transporter ATP-binding protein n=1 Tax=Janibacter cremeus TaxID=1285192 RepID=UPI0023F9755E|nr:ABC transporter ATP-binding protein [Janibacter cremeus]WEV77676.1 ABC transporter ATP-binding protein [Janibacter cremeus]